MASASRLPPARLSSAVGTVSRMASSGPSVATSRLTSALTFLLLGPVPSSSATTSGRETRLTEWAAASGRYPSTRSASSVTRLSTPIVSGFPHCGHIPSQAAD